jgi:hypothetical protein
VPGPNGNKVKGSAELHKLADQKYNSMKDIAGLIVTIDFEKAYCLSR